MKVKSINGLSLEISTDEVIVVTDPLASSEFGLKFPKSDADVVVFSERKYEGKHENIKGFEKLAPKNRADIFEITGAGEFEISQLLIQKPINVPYYIFDSGYSRVVYVGLESKGYDASVFKDLGDVEVLIVPVGNGEKFVDYEKLQEIISEVEPATLIPYGYKSEDMKSELNLKTKEEFLHHFGYTNFRDEKTFKVAARVESEESVMDVVFLS